MFNVFIVNGTCISGICLCTVYIYVLCNYAYLYVLMYLCTAWYFVCVSVMCVVVCSVFAWLLCGAFVFVWYVFFVVCLPMWCVLFV